MVYDDGTLYLRHRRYWPIWSEDRMLGRFCGNATLCVSCHPGACESGDCYGFTANDVAECHAGQSCYRCGTALPGSERRDAS